MIISQTPYRVSFVGGGTDLPAFYEQESGAVLSAALNRHMYVTVSPRFDATTRVAYTKTEIAATLDEIGHTIVREAHRMTGLGRHLEVTTVGDVPAGTGLGSSSTLTVGLLNALYAYQGKITSPERLAQEACRIEIDVLGKPIGRQDQYAAAYGGLNYMRFLPDHTVEVEPVPCRTSTLEEIERRSLMLYTAQQRDADSILERQSQGTADRMSVLREMRDQARQLRVLLSDRGDVDGFGALLHEAWLLKRSLGFGISSSYVDDWYAKARDLGAYGGKLLGAGGGGFLYLQAPPEKHDAIREALGRPREVEFSFDRRGSRVIFISEHRSLEPDAGQGPHGRAEA